MRRLAHGIGALFPWSKDCYIRWENLGLYSCHWAIIRRIPLGGFKSVEYSLSQLLYRCRYQRTKRVPSPG